jgi:hypothetical protein
LGVQPSTHCYLILPKVSLLQCGAPRSIIAPSHDGSIPLGCDYRENSHGASHLTAIRNAPPADDRSTRNTSPVPSSGRVFGKRRVTSIFERIGIRVSHRSRRPWALTLCATVSTSELSPVWNFTKADCRIGYLRSLRRSSRNMDRSPERGYYAGTTSLS